MQLARAAIAGVGCRRGHRSLPMKWRSHSSAARPHLERAHGWIFLELPIFLVATFAGALVAGLSGFAFGLVAASIWLYILTPLQTATLIITSSRRYRPPR